MEKNCGCFPGEENKTQKKPIQFWNNNRQMRPRSTGTIMGIEEYGEGKVQFMI